MARVSVVLLLLLACLLGQIGVAEAVERTYTAWWPVPARSTVMRHISCSWYTYLGRRGVVVGGSAQTRDAYVGYNNHRVTTQGVVNNGYSATAENHEAVAVQLGVSVVCAH